MQKLLSPVRGKRMSASKFAMTTVFATACVVLILLAVNYIYTGKPILYHIDRLMLGASGFAPSVPIDGKKTSAYWTLGIAGVGAFLSIFALKTAKRR